MLKIFQKMFSKKTKVEEETREASTTKKELNPKQNVKTTEKKHDIASAVPTAQVDDTEKAPEKNMTESVQDSHKDSVTANNSETPVKSTFPDKNRPEPTAEPEEAPQFTDKSETTLLGKFYIKQAKDGSYLQNLT